MRQPPAALFTGILLLLLLVSGPPASAQSSTWQITTVTPATTRSGSGDTVLTVSGTQPARVVQNYQLCFYTGTNSTSIASSTSNAGQPTSNFTFTFNIPGSSFQTSAAASTASIYLGNLTPTTCNGTNPGISNTYTYSIPAANYAVNSASPSSSPSGSPDTSITFSGTLPTFPANGTGLGLCFYPGASTTPLLPTSQTGNTSATFTVPAADFSNAGTASAYLAPYTSTCTGTNPGYSATRSYTITPTQRFTITGSSPSIFPAGSGDVSVVLDGSVNGSTSPTNVGVCFYTGTSTTNIPATLTGTQVFFVAPASAFQIPPSSLTDGNYTAQVQLGPSGAACTAASQGLSNTINVSIASPTLDSVSFATLPQTNSAATYVSLPTKLELFGGNFGARLSARFVPADGTQAETSAVSYPPLNAVAPIPRLTGSATSADVYACNYSTGLTYEYCSSTPVTLSIYPLANTATQLTSNPATPALNSIPTLNATITPGLGSTTAGGTYVPGPPTGTVTFADGQTTLGTARLAATSLLWTNASSQEIDLLGPESVPAPPVGSAKAGSATIPRPNDTPSPDNNSQFTSIVADMNQDGIPDILVFQPSTGVIHLFFGGSPAGTLQAETALRQASYFCTSVPGVTVADLNGDGYPDIAYLCGDSGGGNSLAVLLNQGDGTFPQYGVSLAYPYGNQLAAADVNGDGKVDLVVTGQTNSIYSSNPGYGIQTYLNTGNDSSNSPIFSTPTAAQTTTTADIPGTQIILKDLNNDGKADLALLHYNTPASATEVSIYQGNGAGAFTPIRAIPICTCTTSTAKLFATPLSPASLYPDIIVAFPDGTSVLSALNLRTPSLSFSSPATQTITGLRDAVLGDFDADSFPDLAWYNGRTTSVASGNGTGTFTLNPNFQPLDTGTGVRSAISLAAAPDLNLDGYADLLAIRPLIEMDTTTVESYVTTGSATASLATSGFTGPGTHNLTTSYPGNVDLLGSSGSLTLTFTQTAPTIIWSPPSTTTTTTPASTFLNATADVPGTFIYTYLPANAAYLSAGTQTVTAVFTPADTATYSSPSVVRTITVNKTTPSISATINPASHTYAPNLATTYNTLITGTNLVPTGTVQFNNASAPTGAPAGLSPAGTAQATTNIVFSSLPAGAFAFTASYLGDAVYNPVTSTVTNYTVNQSTPTITFTPTPASIPYGIGLLSSQLSATAADPTTGVAIPGTFTYSTPTLPNLQAGAILPVGANALTATFSPSSPNYSSTSGAGIVTVTSSSSSTTLTLNPASTLPAGAVLTLTATVSTPTLTPLGQVNFCDAATSCTGTHLLGSAQLTSAGTATLRLVPAIGTHTYTAIFNGTSQDASSTSSPVTLTVTGLYPTTTVINKTGATGNYTLTATTTGSGTLASSPAGLVTFTDSSNSTSPLASAILVPGTTTQTFPASNPGLTGSIILAADLNNDGVPDLVTGTLVNTQASTQTLSVFLGRGDGTFILASAIPSQGTQVVAGDFDHDGTPDLAVYNASAGSVSILLGLGDGTFTLRSSTSVPSSSGTPLVADFNHDGILDLALGSETSNAAGTTIGTLITLLGVGDGTFTTVQSTISSAASGSITGDFNRDGIPDILATGASATSGSTASVYLGRGDGTFTLRSTLNIANGSIFTSADLNNDGIPDLAALNFYDTSLSTYLGNGDGTFTLKATVANPTATTDQANAFNLSASDFDRDGIPDLAVTADDGIFLYHGAGDGTFTVVSRAIPQTTSPFTGEDFGLAIADFNSDGLPDLVTSAGTATSTNILLALNTLTATSTATATAVAPIGTNTHSVVATYPGDTAFKPSSSAPLGLTGQLLTPTVTFPTPAPVVVGTQLSAMQLNATAVGVTGRPLPGTFTYTPSLGSLVIAGPQTLTALFTPADIVDYTPLSITTTLTGIPVTLTALTPATASVGDPAKTITLTGTGFLPNSVALANGSPLATTYINPTTLTATVPAASLRTVQTLQLTVNDPTQQQTSTPLPFTVNAPAVTIKVTAPATANPGDQPTIQSTLATPYPVDVTATYSLTFIPISGAVIDPAVQFATGGSTVTLTLPAGQTATPTLHIQTGTVAGTITIRLTLATGTTDITPAGLTPTTISIPTVVPGITSVSLVRSGRQLTVNTVGFSNTRQVTQAAFHFTPASGNQIQTPDTTIDVGALFNGWYSQTASTAYGSTFLYTQVFTLDDDATVVGQVTVTLSNGVGVSNSGSSQ